MLRKLYRRFLRDISPAAATLILVGSFTWVLTMIKSGLIYHFGMGFWGPNGHDGIWHMALINGLIKGSWNNPVFAGFPIQNYHIGFDLLVAILYKLTLIPVVNLYFQVVPIILSLSVGIFVNKYVISWTRSKLSAFWAVFFIYFGGNFGWVVTLLRNGKFEGESLFWSQQSISTLINPPFALSLVVLFIGLNLLVSGMQTKNKKVLALATLFFGVLILVKVYAGVLVVLSLFAAGILRLLKTRNITLLKVAVGTLIISVLLFPTLSGGGNIVFKPFWFLETMMASADRFYWPKFSQALENYKLAGNIIKTFLAYFLAFVIFWFGNLGTRFIKELKFIKDIKSIRRLGYVDVLCYSIIFLGVVAPMFMIQSGTPWNTIQFFYYSLMFSGVLAGISLGKYLEAERSSLIYRNGAKIVVMLFIILLTLPTTIGTLWFNYLPGRPPAKISQAEIDALDFLRHQSDGVILTVPFDKASADAELDKPPRPLYLYESTAYVSAFSAKDVYVEDEVNLEITGYDWRERRIKSEKFFTNYDPKFLSENSIGYIYLIKPLKGNTIFQSSKFENIYENAEVLILRPNRQML